ncbi:MAG: LysM peptidoglycan-binding domain-containing protein [Candidatus Berkelbacteria bacterium]|nr:LysM peptidoglycan-binding domain-containing protein [Candidatus Berkelbacteria bacterium]
MFNDEEPPSQEAAKNKNEKGKIGLAINKLVAKTKIKNHFHKTLKFLASGSKLRQRAVWIKTARTVVGRIVYAKNFIVEKRLVPHLSVVAIGVVVALCNVLIARGADNLFNLIPADPSSQIQVTKAIAQYIPLLPNSSDTVAKMLSTSADSGSSFASAVKTTSTEISSQPVAVATTAPTNQSTTISYTVKDGDTLSGLGMTFNVKVASIKFVNNITNVDVIKPGLTIKIPPAEWEPSAAQVAAQAKKTAAVAAVAAKNSATTRVASHPIGTIGGVTYVRRAKYNEMQCYTFVVSQGYPVGGHLLAKWIPTNSQSPRAGGLVVTYESWAGHVAVVTSVNGDGTFNILESNYTHGWITSRTLSVNDSAIKGFVN